MEIKRSGRTYSCAVISLTRGRPETGRIKSDVFFGINIDLFKYSENSKQRKYKVHECKHVGMTQ